MKKISLLLCALALAGISYAQSFNFGLKAGLSLSDLSYNQESGISAKANPGFSVGAFARVYIGDKFYIQPEVAYSFSKIEFDVNAENLIQGTVVNENTKIFNESRQGVSIPVLFGYRLLNLKVANLRVFAGPEFMISTSDFEELTKNVEGFESKPFGVSGMAGIGVDALMVSLDVRYAYPFTNDFVIGDQKSNFQGWVVSLAWKIF